MASSGSASACGRGAQRTVRTAKPGEISALTDSSEGRAERHRPATAAKRRPGAARRRATPRNRSRAPGWTRTQPRKLKPLRSSATHSSTPSRRRTLSSSEGAIQAATFRQVITASRASRLTLDTLLSSSAGVGMPLLEPGVEDFRHHGHRLQVDHHVVLQRGREPAQHAVAGRFGTRARASGRHLLRDSGRGQWLRSWERPSGTRAGLRYCLIHRHRLLAAGPFSPVRRSPRPL